MKELSIEEKAKLYDEAIERVKNIKTGKYETTFIFTEGLFEHIFPELEESEDERIRKQIISFLKEFEHDHYRSLDFSSWIAWLEKQGEQIDIANKEYWRGYREGMEVILDKYSELEKQGEQNPVDKIEPKFKIGQWIVWQDKCYKVNNNGCGYELVDKNGLSTSLEYGTVNENAHLWTIEDAKEGDILVIESGRPFIFKGCLDERHPNSPVAYCGIDCGDDFHVSVEISWWADGNVFPATKEQCDLLFAEMKEAGYEWNVEKKELKKIEQTVEIPFGAKDSELQEATYHIPDGYHAEINDNVVVIKKGEQKPTWSVEDKSKVQRICQYLNEAKKYYADITEVRECIDWLKSLEQRIE